MKKLLLLSALLIFACSSDDSSDSDDNDLMEETFLERYDGVVWQSVEDNPTPPLGSITTFYNNPRMFRRNCYEFYFGIINDDLGYSWNLLSNNGDTLIAEKFYMGGILETSTIVVVDDLLTETITSSEDGNIIREHSAYRTTLTDHPPCN